MKYKSILARSFNRQEQKKLGYGAFCCCLLIVLFFCAILQPYLVPLQALNFQLSMETVGLKMLALKATNSSQQMVRSMNEHSWKIFMSTNDKGNSTLEPDGKIDEEGSRDDSLQVENSTRNTSATFMEKTSQNISETLIEEVTTNKMKPLCNTEETRTEFCDIEREVWIHGKSSSVLVVSSQMDDQFIREGNYSWSIKPYGRKEDKIAMSLVRKWTVKPVKGRQQIRKCTKHHSVPAVLFSLGGYMGNNFHDFTDVVVPLYITSRKFNGEVKFAVTDYRPRWIAKFRIFLEGLSNYEPMAIDREEGIHCFPSAIVGIKRHSRELSIDPSKHSYSMRDFRAFLRSSYALKREKAIRIREGQHKKVEPRLLIISRNKTRSFTNMDEITKMASNLGYKVIATEANSNLSKFAELVNSCDVLMGVHGAGLTNMVFLPEKAVVIQILPFGGFEWLAKDSFGEPSKEMNLKYLEYKIGREESSLIQQYPIDHVVFTDPSSIRRQGWMAFKSIYLDKQNVNLDIIKFRPTLVKSIELLQR
ncbi:hypothetical protein UlMin_008688 [Ulmus minor]